MRNRKVISLVVVVFCAVLVASAFLSVVLESSHATHTCMKDRCVICAALHSVQSVLRHMARLLANTAVAALALLIGYAAAARTARQEKAATLITQKVRLNP